MNLPPLELRNATKLYQTEGAPVVGIQDLSLIAQAGDFIALVGRSGCGKSTVLNLSGAIDFPTAGHVLIDGQPTSDLKDADLTRIRRDKVGFIFQSFQLLNTLSVIENVELPLLLARASNSRDRAKEQLAWVEIAHLAHRLPHQLSGGQQQRVAIARALVHRPRILLADEPTGNLDTTTGELVISLLRRVSTELRVTILMATHSAESAAVADRIIRMKDGVIQQTLVPAESTAS